MQVGSTPMIINFNFLAVIMLFKKETRA
jgi:hypothetical protein